MTGHAKLSPSSSKRWMSCAASIKASEGIPRKSSAASRMGTAEHLVSSVSLEKGLDVAEFLGKSVVFYTTADKPENEIETLDAAPEGSTVVETLVMDEAAIDRISTYVSYVREQVSLTGGELVVEQKLPIDHVTGEDKATGTGDAIIAAGDTLFVIDAKFGVGRVDAVVDGQPNSQLAIYASGALRQFGWMSDFKNVRLVIVQPKINHVSEHSLSVAELETYMEGVKAAADRTRDADAPFKPTSDNCFFCAAKMTCKAREDAALSEVFGDFDDLTTAAVKQVPDTQLGDLYGKLDFIKSWVSDVEARTMAALDNGKPVVRADGLTYKLVEGRKGIRQWRSEEEVIELMESMHLPDGVMYTKKIISPTTAEKLSGGRKPKNMEAAEKLPIGPTRWKKLSELIVQPEGKPEIALETDPRPPKHTLDDFQAMPVAADSADFS